MQETYNVQRHTLWNKVKRYFVRLKSLKTIDGTLNQYFLDGDTFNIRIQCSVLEVLQRIILIKSCHQNTENKKNREKEERKKKTTL